MAHGLVLETPKDIRELIKGWIQEVTVSGGLPFKDGGVVVQMLNIFLKSYQVELEQDIEKRVEKLEKSMERRIRERE
jgi:hypothetical protein